MDKASFTIDRHTPIIPNELWYGLTPADEKIYTLFKNRVALPLSPVGVLLKKKSQRSVPLDVLPRVITNEMLAEAHAAIASAGDLEPELRIYLAGRGLTADEIAAYKICSTAKLVAKLALDTVINLTLRLPDKLKKFVPTTEIVGVSIPCYYPTGEFCGFATRVLHPPEVKYAFSMPQRLCFGLELTRPEIYVVEGVFDAIAMRRAGYNAMAMGDSQPNYFKMMLAARFETVNLLFDDDYAGWLGALKAHATLITMLHKPNDQINILAVGGGHDPETALKHGTVALDKVTVEGAITRAKEWREFDERIQQTTK